MLSPERIAMNNALVAAQRELVAAEQKVNDILTAYRLMDWGKIEKVTWNPTHESDDQGGTYINVDNLSLVIQGESHPVGYSFSDWSTDEVEEDSPAALLIRKYELLGMEEIDAYKHALAELAELSFEDFQDFLELVEVLLTEDEDAGEIKFTP